MASANQKRPLPTIQPLARRLLGGEVYGTLRRMIVQGEFEPGTKLRETQVASMFGVSRTPVREAMQRLQYDGLLTIRPGYPGRVTAPTVDDIEEIYPLMASLEGLAARLATPHLSDGDLGYMDEFTRTMAHHARRRETEELLAADNKFHAVLHRASGNGRLQRIVTELRTRMARFEYIFFSSPQAVRASLKRHQKLVRVLRRGNPAIAQHSLEQQWDLGRRALLDIVQFKKRRVIPKEKGQEKRARARDSKK